MSPFTKFILWMALVASIVCGGMIWVATSARAWSLQEAHDQANKTLVEVGDFCSGTIVDKAKGYISTAAHCAKNLEVQKKEPIYSRDGQDKVQWRRWFEYEKTTVTHRLIDDYGKELGFTVYEAKVIAVDDIHDAAILQNTTSVKFTDEAPMNVAPVKYGDVVYAIGNPFLFPSVVTKGEVVQPALTIPMVGPAPIILCDVAIDRGSSGGGLWNDNGELIGLTNWKKPDGFETFALPIKWVVALLATLDPNKSDKLASVN